MHLHRRSKSSASLTEKVRRAPRVPSATQTLVPLPPTDPRYMHPSAYRSYRAGLRDGELRAHSISLLNRDESDTPLPVLPCLRSQVVVERLPTSAEGSPNSRDGRDSDPPPGYQLTPPLPMSMDSTLQGVEYTYPADSTYTTDSFAESASNHRRARALHRRPQLVRHRPRQSSPLRFCTPAQEGDDDEPALSDSAASDVGTHTESRGTQPYRSRRFAATDPNFLDYIPQQSATVSANGDEEGTSSPVSSSGSMKWSPFAFTRRCGKWVRRRAEVFRGKGEKNKQKKMTIHTRVVSITTVESQVQASPEEDSWVTEGMDPTNTPFDRTAAAGSDTCSITPFSLSRSASSLSTTTSFEKDTHSFVASSDTSASQTPPTSISAPTLSNTNRVRELRRKDNFARRPSTASRSITESLDSAVTTSGRTTPDSFALHAPPPSCASGRTGHSVTSQTPPAITLKRLSDYMAGFDMTTFLRGGGRRSTEILRQVLRDVAGSWLKAHMEEHQRGLVPGGHMFGDFVACPQCSKLLSTIIFAAGKEVAEWASASNPPTFLDLLPVDVVAP